MNKVFRVIWSEAQGTWVAVSENTKSHSKRSRKAALVLALTASSLVGQAWADGQFETTTGQGSIAIGADDCGDAPGVGGDNNITIGCRAGMGAASDTNQNVTYIGYQAGRGAEGNDNTAIGAAAGESVIGDKNTGFGNNAGKRIKGNQNTSLGFEAGDDITGDRNLAAGSNAGTGGLHGSDNVMLGTFARPTGTSQANPVNNAVVIGNRASVTQSDNIAVGTKANATGEKAIALGAEALAEHDNSVALGAGSKTRDAAQVTEGVISFSGGGLPQTQTYGGFAGTAGGVVSVGAAGAERQLIHVAPGAVSKTSTDAINGSQLYGVSKGLNEQIYNLGSSVAESIGGNSQYVGGKVEAELTVGGNTYNNVQDALNNLNMAGGWTLGSVNNAGATQKFNINPGSQLNFDAGKNMEVTSVEDPNTGEVTTTFATKDEVDFTSVTTGETVLSNSGLQVGNDVFVTNQGLQAGNTFITNNGLTFNNSSVAVTATGINAGGEKITNVKAGTAPNDAVNVSQLESVKNTAEQGWQLSTNKGPSEQVKPGDTVDFSAGKNIQISQNGTDITIATTPEVEHDRVIAGDKTGEHSVLDGSGLTVGDTIVSKDGVQVGADVSLNNQGLTAGDTLVTDNGLSFNGSDVSVSKDGIKAGDKKIIGVAKGEISATSTDAVNGSQLHELQVEINKQAGGWTLSDGTTDKQVKAGDKVSIVGGTNIEVEFDAQGDMVVKTTPNVSHDSVTTGDTVMNDNGITINGGPSITKNGINAGDKKIVGVADGEISDTSTDAVNGSQLYETNNRVTINEGDIQNLKTGQDGMFQVSQDFNAPAPTPTGIQSAAGGAGAVASGNYSTAVGNKAQATGHHSTAIGHGASAVANNSVALGQGSVADRANSVSVGSVGGERQITNVAAGVAPTDAVNVSQLEALGSTVNQYFNATNKRIDRVDNNARAGIAAAMAAATLPQSSLPGKSMLTLGGSTYRGEAALAVGVSRLSDNARTVIKANASADSRGHAGAAVGAGWHW